MHRYGVKVKSGRIVWVLAEDVEIREGTLLFVRMLGDRRDVVAGFPLSAVDHFGRPDAFAPSAEST